jgi:post-segregation antitoxin (ccd killing protein)
VRPDSDLIAFRLPRAVLRELRRCARARNLTLSDLIRQALTRELDKARARARARARRASGRRFQELKKKAPELVEGSGAEAPGGSPVKAVARGKTRLQG